MEPDVHNLKEAGCIICEGAESEPIFRLRSIRGFMHPMSLVRCKKCGFEYLNPHFSGPAAASLYNEDYFNKGYISYEKERMGQMERYASMVFTRDHMNGSLSALDIGAGLGYFLMALRKKRDVNCYGVEASSFARLYSEKRFGIRLYDSVAGLPDMKFDLITMWDVIGHIENPGEYMTFCREHIKKTGLLVIKLPNFKSAWHTFSFIIAKYRHVNTIHVPTIIWRFSKSGIRAYLEKFGFRIEKIETAGQPLLGHPGARQRAVKYVTGIVDALTDNRQEMIVYARQN